MQVGSSPPLSHRVASGCKSYLDSESGFDMGSVPVDLFRVNYFPHPSPKPRFEESWALMRQTTLFKFVGGDELLVVI